MKKKSLFKKISNIALTVILVVLFLVIVITLISRASGNVPSLAGFMIFRVSSGSMEPEYEIGDVVLAKNVDNPQEISKGDVITYLGQSGSFSGKRITHKVVVAPYEENGEYFLVTKGIANLTEDPVINFDQVIGKVVTKIPFLGPIYDFFLTPWGLVLTILLIIAAFSGEFWNIYKLSHKEETPKIEKIDDELIAKAVEAYKNDLMNNQDSNSDENRENPK